MSQRIDASRAVFSTNMRSPGVEKGFAAPQSRSSKQMHLRAVDLPVQTVHQQAAIEPAAPSSDRRMFRRKVNRLEMMPHALSKPKIKSFDSPQTFADENLNVFDFQPFNEAAQPEQVYEPVVYNKAAMTYPQENIRSSDMETEETEEAYFVDRPVFLLGQKYFGTRF